MSGLGKMKWDLDEADANPTPMPEGWMRYPAGVGDTKNPCALLPEWVEEEINKPIMFEYRPSHVMGYVLVAAWVGPVEEKWHK